MSVTFTPRNVQYENVLARKLYSYLDPDDDTTLLVCKPEWCEVNFSNVNSAYILNRALGYTGDECTLGEWIYEQLPEILMKLEAARIANHNDLAMHDRIIELQRVVINAMHHKTDVVYA